MGSKGAKGIKETLVGSNTQKVVEKSKTPVLIIKNRHEKFSLRNVVFASDFPEDVLKPFKKLIEFMDLMGDDIDLLYVNSPEDFEESH